MRKVLIAFWLMLPIILAAYHYGPGQQRLKVDSTGVHIQEAKEAVAAEDWDAAITHYASAISQLPDTEVATIHELRLARAKLQMDHCQLPAARQEFQTLLDDLEAEPAKNQALIDETRKSLANAQYYTTWLMRLEGYGEEVWMPEIEASRQNFRLLAENALATSGTATGQKTEDLESAIRLARMDLAELQGLPLPSQ